MMYLYWVATPSSLIPDNLKNYVTVSASEYKLPVTEVSVSLTCKHFIHVITHYPFGNNHIYVWKRICKPVLLHSSSYITIRLILVDKFFSLLNIFVKVFILAFYLKHVSCVPFTSKNGHMRC